MKNLNFKKSAAMMLATVFAIGVATTSHAQIKTAPRLKVGAASKGKASNPVNKEIKGIIKQLRTAEETMKSALPIYSGHRAMAIDLNHIDVEELHLAILGNKIAGKNVKSAKQKVESLKKKPENPERKYTAEEIAASNAKMQQALSEITAAQTALGNVPIDAAGHVADAKTVIGQTISEINAALNAVKSA